jgi:hypothetical protein
MLRGLQLARCDQWETSKSDTLELAMRFRKESTLMQLVLDGHHSEHHERQMVSH